MTQPGGLNLTMRIGQPHKPRGRKRAPQQPIGNPQSPQNMDEERRKRMSADMRKLCLRVAYDWLDRAKTGIIDSQKMQDIGDELEYLVRNGKTDESRDTQRFILAHGEETLHNIQQEEAKAHLAAQDIDVTTDDDTDKLESSGDDLKDFIVSDDHESSDEDHPSPKRRKKIKLEDEEQPEDEPDKHTDEEQLDEIGTDISTVD